VNEEIEVSSDGIKVSELIEFLKLFPPDAILKEVYADSTSFPIEVIGMRRDGKSSVFIGCGW